MSRGGLVEDIVAENETRAFVALEAATRRVSVGVGRFRHYGLYGGAVSACRIAALIVANSPFDRL